MVYFQNLNHVDCKVIKAQAFILMTLKERYIDSLEIYSAC